MRTFYAVRAITHKAMERAHNESKPTVIEFDTYRYYGHSVADAKHKGGYRKEEEIEKYKNEHDPIRLFQNRLMAEKVLTEEQYEAIDAELKSEATAAARFADESPPPTESSVSRMFTLKSIARRRPVAPGDFSSTIEQSKRSARRSRRLGKLHSLNYGTHRISRSSQPGFCRGNRA